jgi:hypothetical protein
MPNGDNAPKEGDKVTASQIDAAVNRDKFPALTPDKNWHTGLFEPWTVGFGYKDGMALYGGVVAEGGEKVHIYYLATSPGQIILLKTGETPEKYGVK